MSGQLLRRGTPPEARHSCDPPERGVRGDVWRCDCGRRWTCTWDYEVFDVPEEDFASTAEPIVNAADWERRYWPWPRTPRREPPPGVDTITLTGNPTGGPTD